MHIADLLLVVAIVAGCGTTSDDLGSHPPAFSEIEIEPRFWTGLAWSSGIGIVLASEGRATEDGPFLWQPKLVSIDPSVGALRTMELPASGCDGLRMLGLADLPSDDVGLADICWDDSVVDERFETTFVALRPDGSFRTLGSFIGDLPPRTFAWNDPMTSVVYEVDGSLCSTIYEFTIDVGVRPLNGTAEVGGDFIELGEDLDADLDGCTRTGRVGRPAYAPDGQRLAVLASPARDRSGQDRIDTPWGLVLVGADGVTTAILEGLRDPLSIAWISSEALIVTATLNGQRGVWRVPVNGDTPVRIASAALGGLAVAPDGRAFAGFPECAPPDCLTLDSSRLLIVSLLATEGN